MSNTIDLDNLVIKAPHADIYYGSSSDQIEIEIFDGNIRVSPDSISISIYNDGSLISGPSSVSEDSENKIKYTIPSDVADEIDEEYRASWTIVIDSKTFIFNQFFDVVRTKFENQINDDDLFKEFPFLKNIGYEKTGTPDSGTTLKLTDQELLSYDKNFFKGGFIEIISGTNQGEVREISDFDPPAIYWNSEMDSTIDSTSRYLLKRSFQNQINSAWEEIENYIKQLGNRPALICSPESFKRPHLFLSLEKICRGHAQSDQEIWWKMADHYYKLYESSISNVKYRYDSTEDGEPDRDKYNVVEFRR